MFILLFISILLIVYIVSFKNDFSEEHINKLTPVVGIVVTLFVISFILGLMGWGV